ncbi:MAG: NAD+ synthase [Alistipes sp.]|jgi:NAD+ synthase (glutamine-hydrolysing)|nr:NAD+ synthase [Alistipes sp.]
MKIAAAQLDYTIGDFEGNSLKIIEAISRAKSLGAHLVVFAQGAISGTPGYDLMRKYTYLEHAEEALVEIASHCDDISVLVGLPTQGTDGTVCAVAHIHNRRIEHFISKKTVTSREEKPYIVPGRGVKYLRIAGEKVAVVVGEDITGDVDFSHNVDLIICPTAHPYCRGIVEKRYNFFSRVAYTAGRPVVYVNQVGGQTDVLFDGSSAAFNARGKAICLLKSFEEDFAVFDTNLNTPPMLVPPQDKTANVFHAMKMGLTDYFRKNGFTRACLGASGGIDSAVVAAMAVEALGKENVRLLMMPSQFSTEHSVDDAVDMAERLGVAYDVLPITEAYKAITETMLPVLGGTRFDTTEENIQSRIRAVMLMALSNKWGYTVLNCSNKSESAVGYGTLYGDTIGAVSIAGDLYKSEIYDIARYINKVRGGVIPDNILSKEPSAELHPGQLDSDRLPTYEVLDAILYRMIEKGQHREEIINAGFDQATVMKVHSMLLKAEYKRRQGGPVFRLSTAPLGKEFIIPLTNKYDEFGM